ncbi:hypothetical protein ACH42_12060 [Endozoicomonas sp. (ex Bugula neritina AB1)]|nr:hypothetical protein ACH42_12060 [Endozoicomonas sp. (ex Bugula neritina AB1)]
MAGNWQGYTNKMLFHSRLLLDAWVDAEIAAKPAFREACLNAMVQAYHSLLAEIMTNYQLSVSQLPTMDDAMTAFNHKGECSSELRYVEQLMQQDSWLSSLVKAHFECMHPAQRINAERSIIPLSPMGLDNLQETESVIKVLESLKELVSYSRNFSLEW